MSVNFDTALHLAKIGVVNQTTMLATETQEITDYLRDIMLQKYGKAEIKNHIADTRDTLCYATNDNQSATYGLLETEADLAVVVGGYNSSNTSHLVELLEAKFPTFYIMNQEEILSKSSIKSFDIHSSEIISQNSFIPEKENVRIIISSGASCPDALVDGVLHKIISLIDPTVDTTELLNQI
jgi:4-hydroxy-3-methylbut-2-enyl diphosphate reductase